MFKNEVFRICKLLIIFVGFRYPKENILVEDSLQSLGFTDFNVLQLYLVTYDLWVIGSTRHILSFVTDIATQNTDAKTSMVVNFFERNRLSGHSKINPAFPWGKLCSSTSVESCPL